MTTANAFSIESVSFKATMKAPFGVHKPWKYQSKEALEELVKVCPSIQGLMEVNGVSSPLGEVELSELKQRVGEDL